MPTKSYKVINNGEIPEMILNVTYTQAVVEHKNWKFIISPERDLSCNPDMTFEIKVLHDDFYGDDVYLTNSGHGYLSPKPITSFDEALEKIKKFISNELK